jgi:hypothetical protein
MLRSRNFAQLKRSRSYIGVQNIAEEFYFKKFFVGLWDCHKGFFSVKAENLSLAEH